MKTIQINAVYGAKSTGLVVKDINDILREKGIESYIGYQKSDKSVPNGIQIGNLFDWKYHALYTRITGLQAYASIHATTELLNQLDSIEPEVMHLHNLHANYINLPMLLRYCADKNIKTILTLHDCWFFTGKCFHSYDINCEKYKNGCYDCPKKKTDIPNFSSDKSSRVWSDRRDSFRKIGNLKVIGCSEWIAQMAGESEIFADKTVLAIHNGVDTSIFCKRDRHLRARNNLSDKFIVLVFANKWFEEANATVRREMLDGIEEDTVLYIVGCNAAQKKLCEIDKRLLPVGYISNREALANIYSMADVFVNLSLIDNLPTVNMESICCGTPVICYDKSGGGPELVQKGKTGFVVSKFTTSEILKYIAATKNGEIDRDECSKVGIREFDRKRNYSRYFDEYTKW